MSYDERKQRLIWAGIQGMKLLNELLQHNCWTCIHCHFPDGPSCLALTGDEPRDHAILKWIDATHEPPEARMPPKWADDCPGWERLH